MRKTVMAVNLEYAPAVLQFPGSQAQNKIVFDDEEVPTYEASCAAFCAGSHVGYGAGAGGRFTYNLNKYIAFIVKWFSCRTKDHPTTQGLFGIKAGTHQNVWHLRQARPGFQTNFVVNGRTGKVCAGRGCRCRSLSLP